MKKAKREKRDGRAHRGHEGRLVTESVADGWPAATGAPHRTQAPRELKISTGPVRWSAAVERRFGMMSARDLELTLRARGTAVAFFPRLPGEGEDTPLLRRCIRRRSGRHWLIDVVQMGILPLQPMVLIHLADWTTREVFAVKVCSGRDSDDVLTGLDTLTQKYGKPDVLSLDHDHDADLDELAKLILNWAVDWGICIAFAMPCSARLPDRWAAGRS